MVWSSGRWAARTTSGARLKCFTRGRARTDDLREEFEGARYATLGLWMRGGSSKQSARGEVAVLPDMDELGRERLTALFRATPSIRRPLVRFIGSIGGREHGQDCGYRLGRSLDGPSSNTHEHSIRCLFLHRLQPERPLHSVAGQQKHITPQRRQKILR